MIFSQIISVETFAIKSTIVISIAIAIVIAMRIISTILITMLQPGDRSDRSSCLETLKSIEIMSDENNFSLIYFR